MRRYDRTGIHSQPQVLRLVLAAAADTLWLDFPAPVDTIIRDEWSEAVELHLIPCRSAAPPKQGAEDRHVNAELVRAWLRKTVRSARAWKCASVVGCLFSGLLILFVSFWASYGVLWFLSRSLYPLPQPVLLLIAAGFMVVVIIVGAKQKREDIEPVDRQVRLARELDLTLSPSSRLGISLNSDFSRAEAFEVRTLASVVNYILCGGVLLCRSAWTSLGQFGRLRQIDIDGCARVIALLQAVARRQSFEEIVAKLPGLNPVKVFEDLHYIEGVLFLSSEPSGLTLHPELKSELGRLSAPGGNGR